MFLADLTSHPYIKSVNGQTALCIGWLDKEHPYPTGKSNSDFLVKLTQFCCHPVFMTLGYHTPNLGNETQEIVISFKGKKRILGAGHTLIFGNFYTFIIPDLICYYVEHYHYLPPDEFIEAVYHCPLPDTPEYQVCSQDWGL